MKHSRIALLAICLLTSAARAFPNGGRPSSREDPWDRSVNWIIDKTDNVKTETPEDVAYLKNHMDSSGTQDTLEGQNPQVRFEHKLSVGSEKLHPHLMQELSRLQEKLAPYTSQSRLGPGHFQTCLATHTQHLQTIFSGNVRELCSRLHHHVGGLEETAGAAACQESTRRVVLTLDQGVQELQSHLDNFDAQVSEATGTSGDANRSKPWREAAAGLGRGVREAAEALRAAATGHPPGASGQRLSQGVTLFCHRSMAYIEHFDTWVKRQSEGPERQWVRGHPLHGRLSTLTGDFSAALNALLTDIRQTLN